MKTKWKVAIGILVLLLIAGCVLGGIKYSRRNIPTVQTGKVVREDLAAVVSASGEIKPRNYINIGAEYQGQLTEILVKEGDHVRKDSFWPVSTKHSRPPMWKRRRRR